MFNPKKTLLKVLAGSMLISAAFSAHATLITSTVTGKIGSINNTGSGLATALGFQPIAGQAYSLSITQDLSGATSSATNSLLIDTVGSVDIALTIGGTTRLFNAASTRQYNSLIDGAPDSLTTLSEIVVGNQKLSFSHTVTGNLWSTADLGQPLALSKGQFATLYSKLSISSLTGAYQGGFTGVGSSLVAQQAVPEPGTMALMGLGLMGLVYSRRRAAKR